MSSPATPLRPLGHRIRWSFVNSIAGLLAAAAMLLVVSRMVEPRVYGRVSVITAAWGLLLTPITWCGSLLMRFGPVEFESRQGLQQTIAARLVFIWAVVPPLCVGGLVYLWLALHWSTTELALTFGYLIAASAFDVLNWSAIAAQRFAAMTSANIVLRAIPIVVLMFSHFDHFAISAPLLLSATTAATAMAALVYLFSLRGIVGVAALDRALLSRMWRYILPMLWGVPGQAATLWLDPLLLAHWTASAEVGRYQLAYPTITIFAALGAAINSVLSPELVRAGAAGRADAITRYASNVQPLIALLGASLAFGAACIAPEVLHFLLPARYAPTAQLMALLSIAGGFLLGCWSISPIVTVTDSLAYAQVSTLLQAITNVLGDIVLAPRYGGRGVALANICAWAASFVVLSLLMRRKVSLPRWSILAVLAGGAAALAVLVSSHSVVVHALASVVFAALALGIVQRVRHVRAP